jgi:hypothetical protein
LSGVALVALGWDAGANRFLMGAMIPGLARWPWSGLVTLSRGVTREEEEKGDGPTVGKQASCREFAISGLKWFMAPGGERGLQRCCQSVKLQASLSLAEITP